METKINFLIVRQHSSSLLKTRTCCSQQKRNDSYPYNYIILYYILCVCVCVCVCWMKDHIQTERPRNLIFCAHIDLNQYSVTDYSGLISSDRKINHFSPVRRRINYLWSLCSNNVDNMASYKLAFLEKILEKESIYFQKVEGVRGVMVIVEENGYSSTGSNTGRGSLYFTLWEKYASNYFSFSYG